MREWLAKGRERFHGKRNTCKHVKKISNINARNIEKPVQWREHAMCTLRRVTHFDAIHIDIE